MDDGLLFLKAQIGLLWPYVPNPKMGIAAQAELLLRDPRPLSRPGNPVAGLSVRRDWGESWLPSPAQGLSVG